MNGDDLQIAIMLAAYPNLPSENLAALTALRPSSRLMTIGQAYEAVSEMTPTPEKALKAAEDPK